MKDQAADNTPVGVNDEEQEGPFGENDPEKPKKKKVTFSTSEPEHMSQKMVAR